MNWGKGILIFYLIFVGFMGWMIYKSVTQDPELVTNNYYQEELNYQSKIDKMKNARDDGQQVTVNNTADGVQLVFPDSALSGTVKFFRPSDGSKDFQLALQSVNGKQLIPFNQFITGKYQIQLDWKSNNREYYQEGPLYIP